MDGPSDPLAYFSCQFPFDAGVYFVIDPDRNRVARLLQMASEARRRDNLLSRRNLPRGQRSYWIESSSEGATEPRNNWGY